MRIQRGKYLFNYKDCWSMDMTLSPIIHAGLVKFKEELIKHPCAGYPSDFHKGDSQEDSEEAYQEWLDTISKMIYTFDVSQEPDIMDYDFKFDTHWETLGNGNSELISIDPTDEDEYNRYKEDTEKWYEDKKGGLKLFSEYFDHLWI